MDHPTAVPTVGSAPRLDREASESKCSQTGSLEQIVLTLPHGTSPNGNAAPKDIRFWMIILSLAMSMFLSAIDLTAITMIVPTIANEFQSNDFAWVGSAYALSSTVFLPVFGGLAETFGRKINLVASILLFAAGSAVCASSHTMTQMIVGRTVQGVGGGGILSLAEIVVADLVPLKERGLFISILGTVWALAAAIGPIGGGALANVNWRWLFWMNLPVSGMALTLVMVCMKLKVPEGGLKVKLGRVDWLGSGLFVISATLITLGLTFGGDIFAWKSAGTLTPLCIGFAVLPLFIYAEKRLAKYPILPFELFNLTSAIGYITTFLHGIITMAVIFFLPSWFMAIEGNSPRKAAVNVFPLAFLIAPFGIISGATVQATQKYKMLNVVGWVMCTTGAGLLTLLSVHSSHATNIGAQVPISIGLGLLYMAAQFAVLAPLSPTQSAHAMSFFAFSRAFGQVVGITIGTAVLSNELSRKLPPQFLETLHGIPSATFAEIRSLSELPDGLRALVQAAYSDSIRCIWFVLIGVAAVGLSVSVFMKGLTLAAHTDEAWGVEGATAPSEAQSEKA